ncbi:hypothetical protein OIDMADRAFT_129240 [Oidiodendron maius Zn]|uniref:Uncharacterized protein n=1 Tax=Oidiodendron maius (strain Zn) TaxID=913774 RepID=A0A0C3CFZ6_OIDMZ|nr:hypothetical protein OIDMADRAFT_129240 [Oidiodendron maius Zn]
MDRVQATGRVGKRKATDSQDNERLTKRLSLLNLERNGEKLYVPVEQTYVGSPPPFKPKAPIQALDNDVMRLDDSKHKVYIYDLDAELSESESDDGKLVFLPDIEKHLRESRIPPPVLANCEGELAGNKQLVLYNIPSSLTVPEERDNVRKAIMEARARVRERQEGRKQTEERDVGARNELINGGMNSRFGFHVAAGETSTAIPRIPEADEYDPDAMDLG